MDRKNAAYKTMVVLFVIGTFVLFIILSFITHINRSTSVSDKVQICKDVTYTQYGITQRIDDYPLRINCRPDSDITLTYDIPQLLPVPCVLSFITRYCDVSCTVDGKNIYTQNTSGKYPVGIVTNNIPLQRENEGKQVVVTLHSYMNSVYISESYIGDPSAIRMGQIRGDFLSSLLCYCGIFVALMFMAAAVYMLKKKEEMHTLLSFAIFIGCVFGWALTEKVTVRLQEMNNTLEFFMSYFLYMMLPVSFLQLFKNIIGGKIKAVNRLTFIFALDMFVSALLHITGACPLYRSVTISHILIILTLVFLIVWSIMNRKRITREKILPLAGMTIMCIGFAVTLARFYVSANYRNTIFIICAYVAILLMGIYALKYIDAAVYHANRVKILEKVYLLDGLTKLYSRTTYEWRKSGRIEDVAFKGNVGVVMVDIDNFKMINDTYGHKEGDRCLVTLSKTILDVFKGTGGQCYRMGGDEFAVIVSNTAKTETKARISNLRERISVSQCGFEISCGYAEGIIDKNSPKTKAIDQLLDEADKAMYNEKYRKRTYTKK